MASVERLYELYNIISQSKDGVSKHETEFAEIITGTKGGAGERRLASQFIAHYFMDFKKHQDQALNALFDLCEDDDVSIRKQAIKDLPSLCRGRPDLVPKVADILAQLLQMEDSGEVSTVQNSLVILFKIDAKGALTGIFYQIENSGDEVVRERCVRFLNSKIRQLGSDVFKPDVEALILTEAKKILQDSSEDEFLLMMGVLRQLKTCQTQKGHQQLVDLVAEQFDFTRAIDTTDLESIHRLSACVKQALPLFSMVVKSTQFVQYMYKEVVPILGQLDAATTDGTTTPSLALDLMKTLAELLRWSAPMEDLETKVAAVYAQLMEVMPVPPEGEAATEALESGLTLEFSRVECLLFIFHLLARKQEEFLSENPDRLKDFRARLQYFARASQAYQKKLREAISDKKGEELKTEESKIKLIALKTTANINTLIKDLFHQPPSYKASVTLSWIMASKHEPAMNGAEKRHATITYDSSGNKKFKGERQIYSPPRNKFSSVAGQYRNVRGRARGRGLSGPRFTARGRGGSRIGRGTFRRF